MTIREFREKVNLSLYSSKNTVTLIQRIVMALVTLTAFGALIHYYGFPQTFESKNRLIEIFKFSFVVYIINYILKYIYDFEPVNFFKRTWFEGILMLILVVEGISYNLFGDLLLSSVFENVGIEITTYSNLLIQVYFLIVAFYEAGKTSTVLPKIRLHPSNVFMISFLIIILGGAGLLMLPEMSIKSQSMQFIDALFLSTSASCVTGLSTLNLGNFLTFKGQLVVLCLIKIGGLNVVIFGSFIALASKFGMGIKQHSIIEDFMNKNSMFSAKGIMQKILIWSISIELIGTTLLFFSWEDYIFDSTSDRFFASIFHSVSAFNNAGFSIFPQGYFTEGVRFNYVVHNITAILIFTGALGFVALFDIFDWNRLKSRIAQPWKSFSFGTKIALYFSLGLVFVGWFFFLIFESDHTMKNLGFLESVSHSFFQSISSRTAGFNTLDVGSFSGSTMFMVMFLMFIGGSSSSTSGGIKTSTFAVLWASVIGTIRGREHAQIFKKTISNELVFKAISIISVSILLIIIGIIILCLTEEQLLNTAEFDIMDIVFEEVSAFTTTGSSTGITPFLSYSGKMVLVFTMFIGRVGMLTIAYAIGKEAISKNYKYPKGHTMIG